MKREKAAVCIQRFVRGHLARGEYARQMRRVVLVQGAVRRYQARKPLKKLKLDAMSVEHQKSLNKGLNDLLHSKHSRYTSVWIEQKLLGTSIVFSVWTSLVAIIFPASVCFCLICSLSSSPDVAR